MLKRIINRFKNSGKCSYSQCGEDLIIDSVFYGLGITMPTYLDIGAHHPTILSNTYYFYKKGSRGVCVEPDPFLHDVIQRKRKRDTCLNVGVGVTDSESADFYVMSHRFLNTFSKEEAERYESFGTTEIEKVLKLPLLNINRILEEYTSETPNLVSIDIEGLDLEVVRTFDFKRFRPEVFCVETITYAEDASESKVTGIISLFESNGYIVYADTYINTIFVDAKKWKSRKTG